MKIVIKKDNRMDKESLQFIQKAVNKKRIILALVQTNGGIFYTNKELLFLKRDSKIAIQK